MYIWFRVVLNDVLEVDALVVGLQHSDVAFTAVQLGLIWDVLNKTSPILLILLPSLLTDMVCGVVAKKNEVLPETVAITHNLLEKFAVDVIAKAM